MSKRYNYVIGDVQGCFEALKALLKEIRFDPDQDFLWFAGDLVARGENSVGALRFVKKLADRGAAATVLGNHDLTLITHAGVPCIWSAEQTVQLASEVQQVVGHDDLTVLDAFLAEMYGEQPDLWSDDLTGQARLRCITNYLTRMRLTNAEGRLEFEFKDALDAPMPTGFQPWFEFKSQAAQTHQLIFGHWAALQGKTISPQIQNVDGGCVWGQQLVALRLEDQQLFKVDNPLI